MTINDVECRSRPWAAPADVLTCGAGSRARGGLAVSLRSTACTTDSAAAVSLAPVHRGRAPGAPARPSRPPPVVFVSRPPDFVKGGCPCGGEGLMSVRQPFRHQASPGSVPAGVPENFSL